MLKRYDVSKDEMVELTQEYFDATEKRLRKISLDYKNNDPINFKKFFEANKEDYLTGIK